MSRVVGTARTSLATWACLATLLVAGCEKSAEEKAKDRASVAAARAALSPLEPPC